LLEEVIAHAQSDSLEDAQGICADGTYFPNNLRTTSAFLSPTATCKTSYLIFQPLQNQVG